ncbi:uncharacterized protein LOC106060230 isoform X1 [Biomphalaria glabrata]|uniref:Uncharacterized protein LOC106060230 isoform X1 n=1 Tax=Biomphalaria glabrata TaxID=6526 RepID=A0A9W2ZZF9_BIOGL|nr:uncharacterized protein LOC106060230 isoform X1 [Biomphalaria glabrata]
MTRHFGSLLCQSVSTKQLKAGLRMSNLWSLSVFCLTLYVTCQAFGLPGGWSPATLANDHPVVVFLMTKVNQTYAEQGDSAERTLVKTEVKQQVVAGVNYDITAYLEAGLERDKCVGVVWAREWLNEPDRYQLTKGPNCTKV